MPGVPSSRGCEACRKQKKRCDQKAPICSRCQRLGIQCIGNGKQRFRFRSPQTVSATSNARIRVVQTVSRSPSPTIDALTAGAFTSLLEVADIRFDLECYGPFMKEIPQRIGKSKALDASVKSLIAAYPRLHTRENSVEAITKYGEAFRVLASTLNDPVQTQTTDTLIAIYFMIVCRGWVGTREECRFSHGLGMAYILNVVAARETKSHLHLMVFATIVIVVLLERIHNPKIYLSSWFWKLTAENGPRRPLEGNAQKYSDVKLQDLARIVDYIREPEDHLVDIEYSYHLIKNESVKMRERWEEKCLGAANELITTGPPHLARVARNYQTGYAMLLGLALVLNTFLRVADPGNAQLLADNQALVADTVLLSRGGLLQRPLGSSYMPMCIAAALVATDDVSIKSACEELIAEYSNDFAETEWLEMASWLQYKVDALRLSVAKARAVEEVGFGEEEARLENTLEQMDVEKMSCTFL